MVIIKRYWCGFAHHKNPKQKTNAGALMIFGRYWSLWKDSQIINIKILPAVEMKMKKKKSPYS